jgi:hypothetical protein
MTSDHFSTVSQLWCGSGLQSEQMKLKLTLFLALMCTAPLAQNVFAQSPPDRPDRPFRQFLTERRAARLANLNDDERNRLRAAYQKALQDPAVQAAREKMKQARREFREVMRPALLKADPSVQPILEKLRAERQERADRQ